jgi:diguanylate cyclase (GGDEF)-like protein/PAS domain S-box-containing protein
MIENIRLIVITESTAVKRSIVQRLRTEVANITYVDTMVDGLSAVKRNRFDAAILSNDMEDFYSVSNMVRILQEVGSLQFILLISERAEPDATGQEKPVQGVLIDSADSTVKLVLDKLALMRDARESEKKPVAQDEDLKERLSADTPLFHSVPTGLYRIDSNGDFVEVNHTLAQMLRAPSIDVVLADNYFSTFNDADGKNVWQDIIKRDDYLRGLIFEIERYDGQTIWVRDTARAVFDEKGNQKYYDGSLEDITFQKKLDDKLSFLATQDILTGLPNRNFFQDQAKLTISQARYNEDIVALLVVDMDHFSEINDRYGHKTGDRILQIVAGRIKSQLRKSDLVSRLGSDKFIALLNGLRNRRDVLAVAKKISLGFATPFVVQDKEIPLTASIGISLYPEHGDEVNTLIKRAEIATYAVKERERGGYMIYSDVIHTNYETNG